MSRVVGLDLALTSSGVCVVDTIDRTVDVATVTSSGRADATLAQRHRRLARLALELDAYPLGLRPAAALQADLVVIEGPSYGQARQGGQHDRAGLWWLVMAHLHDLGFTVAEVPPAARARYACGKGNAAKDAVLAAVVRRYPDVPVAGNDQADALVLAAMGARWLCEPVEDSLSAAHLTAMASVRWPEVGDDTAAPAVGE